MDYGAEASDGLGARLGVGSGWRRSNASAASTCRRGQRGIARVAIDSFIFPLNPSIWSMNGGRERRHVTVPPC